MNINDLIPVYEPWLTDSERSFLLSAFDTGWISSAGRFVRLSESALERLLNVGRAHVTSSGTTALHLCLRALGVGPGDRVIVPACTFAATAFAVSYTGAEPVFVDSDPHSWNLDLDLVEDLVNKGEANIVVPVHLFGNPVDMQRLKEICEPKGVKIVEDACESLGASIDGKMTGTWSDIACFSFYGNKTLTAGEGGAVVTDDQELADKALLLRGQAQAPNTRYWHIDVGHNYRMTNMQAAILYGQMERFEEIDHEKKRVANRYRANLGGHERIKMQKVADNAYHSWWVISVVTPTEYPAMAAHLREHGADSRPIFYPLTAMPPYKTCKVVSKADSGMPIVADYLNRMGITLPSSPLLTNAQVDRVCDGIISSLD